MIFHGPSRPPSLMLAHCFVTQGALASQITVFQMLAYPTKDKKQRPPSRTAAYLLLLLTFLWAFLGTIDGLAVNFGITAGSVVCRTAKILDWDHGVKPGPLCIGVLLDEPPPVHASFLLVDFKQNLRRWPNVAGDISRSPPFFLAI